MGKRLYYLCSYVRSPANLTFVSKTAIVKHSTRTITQGTYLILDLLLYNHVLFLCGDPVYRLCLDWYLIIIIVRVQTIHNSTETKTQYKNSLMYKNDKLRAWWKGTTDFIAWVSMWISTYIIPQKAVLAKNEY